MKTSFHIFWQFLLLGLVSFGGPASHIGYFRNTFVDQKKWLTDLEYAQLVALSQFLPGPGSSQVGFAIGHQKGGLLGGIAAFLGFTLPSFVLIVLFAFLTTSQLLDTVTIDGVIRGLKLLAVVIVFDAILGMYQSFCQKRLAASIAFISAAILILQPSLTNQLVLIVVAGLIGFLFSSALINGDVFKQHNLIENRSNTSSKNDKNNRDTNNLRNGHFANLIKLNWTAAFLFLLLALGLPVFGNESVWIKLVADFYHAGSLVFGGGHVVLPLLQELVADNISDDRFLVGYAAAQAVPGPMFTFASFLGVELQPSSPWLGATLATLAIFTPGFILILIFKNAWLSLASLPKMAGVVSGINACVVGLLMSALYAPVVSSGINSNIDVALAMIGFMALRFHKTPVVYLVIFYMMLGLFLN